MKSHHEIIEKPLISEQSLKDAEGGLYSFIVDKSASKTEIKRAIEGIFGVSVKKVMTNTVKGTKTRLTRQRRIVTDGSYKKARVSLSKGEKIDIFDEHIEGK